MAIYKLKYNFVETPHKFIITELSIRKLGSSSVLIIMRHFISIDEVPILWIESSAIINLGGVSTKLYFNYPESILSFYLRVCLTAVPMLGTLSQDSQCIKVTNAIEH